MFKRLFDRRDILSSYLQFANLLVVHFASILAIVVASCDVYDASLLDINDLHEGFDTSQMSDGFERNRVNPENDAEQSASPGPDNRGSIEGEEEEHLRNSVNRDLLSTGNCIEDSKDVLCPIRCLEACDGYDNDCDGEVDEGIWEDKGKRCYFFSGECLLEGEFVCDEKIPYGLLVCDSVRTGEKHEICDGYDNDCDGLTDEEFADTDNDNVADCVDDELNSPDRDSGTPDRDSDMPDRDDDAIEYGCKRITIDASYVDEDLNSFPVLIRIDGDGAIRRAGDDGRDIHFTEADDDTVLCSEIEYWNKDDGSLIVWVGIPTVSSTEDTVFYLNYGGDIVESSESEPSCVWDADYAAVWHLSSDRRDSSSSGLDGSDGTSEEIDGYIADAIFLDGDSDYIYIGAGLLRDSEYYTITAWVKPDLSDGDDQYAVVSNCATNGEFNGANLFIRRNDGALGVWEWDDEIGDSWHFSQNHTVRDDEWSFIAVTTWKSAILGNASASINGQAWEPFYFNNTEGFTNDDEGRLNIGRFHSGYNYYNGIIDEVRISEEFRSEAWIRAEYENQRKDSSFLIIEDD